MRQKHLFLLILLVLTMISVKQATAVVEDTGGNPIAIIIMSPMILGLFFLIGAALLDQEEHGVLKIGLILLSFMTYFMTAWMAVQTLIKYYDFAELQESTAIGVMTFGIMIGVIVTYFLIYAFYKAIHAAAQKKDEMMLK